ncbi:MAG: carboxypeptidase-like regulatory domain-containing protein [Chitinophagaceae bacterium]
MIKYIFIVGLLFPFGITAQTILGKVTNSKKKPMIGATIYWIGSNIGASTGEKGLFEITSKHTGNSKLVASFVGYISDTIEITNQSFVEFKLIEVKPLNDVVVQGKRNGIIISNISPIKTEVITQSELKKAACCDLAGCFETQATVQPQTTNVITNSKELRILGISGVYNQVLIDGLPMIQGLSYTYGISGIPGTLVENITISKGTNSVLQGYESISGQINVETKEPTKTEKLLLNVYMNNFLEKHINANYTFKVKKWSSLAALHTVQPANKVDRDNDTFLDLPQLTRYMLFNKWKYGNEKDWGLSSQIGLRFLNEERNGGQTFYNPKSDKGSTNVYGQTVKITQPEIWTKTSYRFNDNHRITFLASSFYQDQESFFGTVNYNAQQTNIYGNLQYELLYAQKNSLKTGISYRHLKLNESIAFTDTTLKRTYAGNYKREENIPGIFAENVMYFFKDKLTWIAGIRGDEHNQFGFTVTPRTLLKYDVSAQYCFSCKYWYRLENCKLI